MAIPAGLHLQPLSPCSTCSVSDETSAMPSNAMDDEASEATARDLDVDKLRAGRVKTGANVSVQTTCSGRDDWGSHDVVPVGS